MFCKAFILEIMVLRWLHFVCCWLVYPNLKTVQCAFFHHRHLTVNHTTTRGHPLCATAAKFTDIPHVVLVLEVTFKHVSERFYPTVRVRRKATNIVLAFIRLKFVDHQKWRETRVIETSESLDFDAITIGSGMCCNHMIYCSYIRHFETLINWNSCSLCNLISKEDGIALSVLFENLEQVRI